MGDLRYYYPAERLPDGTTTDEWLRYLTFEGAKRFDAEVGVTDAIKGKALALAIDATEAAADAPARARPDQPVCWEPKRTV